MNPNTKNRLNSYGRSVLAIATAWSVYKCVGDHNTQKDAAQLEYLSQEVTHLNLASQTLESHAAPAIVQDCRKKAIACTNHYPMPCDGHSFEGEHKDNALGYRQIDDGKQSRACKIGLREKLVDCLNAQMKCVTNSLSTVAVNEE